MDNTENTQVYSVKEEIRLLLSENRKLKETENPLPVDHELMKRVYNTLRSTLEKNFTTLTKEERAELTRVFVGLLNEQPLTNVKCRPKDFVNSNGTVSFNKRTDLIQRVDLTGVKYITNKVRFIDVDTDEEIDIETIGNVSRAQRFNNSVLEVDFINKPIVLYARKDQDSYVLATEYNDKEIVANLKKHSYTPNN